MPYPVVLGFPDRKVKDERAPVIGEDGELVATLNPATRRYRFEAQDPDGNPICSGRMRNGMGWEAVDADGAELVRMGPGFFGRYSLRLRGGELRLAMRGRAYKGELTVLSPEKEFLINSIPGHESWDFADRDWVLRSDGTLTLAEVIAVVELHRLEMRRRRKPSPRKRRRLPDPRMRGYDVMPPGAREA